MTLAFSGLSYDSNCIYLFLNVFFSNLTCLECAFWLSLCLALQSYSSDHRCW